MSWRIPLSDLRLSAAQRAAAGEVLDSGWLSMGPRTHEFEAAFGQAAGVEHAVAVASGTAGLLLALEACGVKAGDEVVLPSLSFVADANVVRRLGATPVFADIESLDRPLVDPKDVLSAVTSRTKAVLVVHYAGYEVDLAPVLGQGFAVIEDAAHAVGPLTADGAWMPLHGDIAVHSFFANKNLPLGEGGMVTAHDRGLADGVRLLRSHGMTSLTWDRHHGHAADYDVVAIGTNVRPTELQAALGTAGLDDLPTNNEGRRQTLRQYADGFAGSAVRLIFDGDQRTTAHLAVVVLPEPGIRSRIRDAMTEAGIQTSFHYPPIHQFTAYADLPSRALPNTEAAAERLVTLPLHPYLTDSDVAVVVETLLKAV